MPRLDLGTLKDIRLMKLKPLGQGKHHIYRNGHETMTVYRRKVVISGDVVEVFTYPKDQYRGYNVIKSVNDLTTGYSEEEMEKDRSEYSTLRSQQRMRNLVNANFTQGDKMLTLTFASPKMQLLETTNPIFHSFIRRLKEYCNKMKNSRPRGIQLSSWKNFNKLKYLAVVEWQNDIDFKGIVKEFGGNVHYHLILNIPYIDKKIISELWGHGFIKIKRISDKKNVGAYFAKHGTKHDVMEKEKLKGHKKHFGSRGLMKPIELYEKTEVDEFLDHHSLVQEFEKDVEVFGEIVVKYRQYRICA